MTTPRSGSAVSRTGCQFLYEHVTGELRRRIGRSVYQPGTAIPSEAELVREFGVSAITIRRALRDLTVEGLVFGRQGLGVFVSDSRRIVRSLHSASTTSIGDEIRRAGFEPRIKELSWSTVAAAEDIAGRLAVEPGTVLHRHEKMILADGEPVTRELIYLPRPIGELFRAQLAEEFVFAVLANSGLAVDRIDFRLEGSAISDEQAALFGLPIGFPVIVVHYTAIRTDGTPLLTGHLLSRADRLSFDICVRLATS
jgi:DNA-binding GntR family transcriptional regulator